jgi:hypothetical protein
VVQGDADLTVVRSIGGDVQESDGNSTANVEIQGAASTSTMAGGFTCFLPNKVIGNANCRPALRRPAFFCQDAQHPAEDLMIGLCSPRKPINELLQGKKVNILDSGTKFFEK